MLFKCACYVKPRACLFIGDTCSTKHHWERGVGGALYAYLLVRSIDRVTAAINDRRFILFYFTFFCKKMNKIRCNIFFIINTVYCVNYNLEKFFVVKNRKNILKYDVFSNLTPIHNRINNYSLLMCLIILSQYTIN